MRMFSFGKTGSLTLAGIALLASLVGCGINGGSSATSTGASPISLTKKMSGRVHGGVQPVTGSTIQLYAAGAPATATGGYGQGATALIPAGSYFPGGLPGCTGGTCTTLPQTDASGSFLITGDYTCNAGQLVYIVATGGNTGSGNNPNLALMAVLGTCPASKTLALTVPIVNINEVTTVAAVYALQQFMAVPAAATKLAPAVGAPGTLYTGGTLSVQSAVVGLTNAFNMAKILADVSLGTAPNTNFAYATPETAKINTIADILTYCVNSTGGTTGDSTPCGNLFASATPATLPAGGAAPADTIQAAWYMAQNPVNNVATLLGYIPSSPAFLPNSSSLTDFTVAVNFAPTYSGGNALNESYGIGIDAFGNAWIVNAGGLANSAPTGVVELGVDGSAITTPVSTFTVAASGGAASQFTTAPATNARTFTAPTFLAVDLNDNAWVPNTGDISTGGTPIATPIAEFTGSTSALAAGTGTVVPTVGGFWTNYSAEGIAIDGNNNIYTASSSSSSLSAATLMDQRSVAKMAPDGTAYTYSTSVSTSAPSATPGGATLLAIDNNTSAGGIVWGLDSSSCKTQGQGINATTTWGLINQYSATSISTPLSGSQIATTISGVAVGTSGTCGSSSVKPAQAISAFMSTPSGIAIDRNNGVWITDQEAGTSPNLSGFDGLTYLAAPASATGTIANSYNLVNGALGTSTTGSTAGTVMVRSTGVAVDGNNNAWVASSSLHTVAEAAINTANNPAITLLTPATVGFTHTVAGSMALAIDPSGNVWVTNKNATSNYTNQAGVTTPDGNSVTVIVGAAGPVVTPAALALKNNRLGQLP